MGSPQNTVAIYNTPPLACPGPISNLANELLLAVFIAGIDLESEWNYEGSKSFPVLISHVCQLWRAIAIDAAELWTIICVHLSSSNSRARAQLYASRARSRVIQLHIDITPLGIFGTKATQLETFLLTIFGLHLTELNIKGRRMSDIDLILRCLRTRASSLQRLEYSAEFDDHDHPLVAVEQVDYLPALRHLKAVHGCSSCHPRLAKLVHLHITDLSAAELAVVIQDCPALQTLALPRFKVARVQDHSTGVISSVEAISVKRFAASFQQLTPDASVTHLHMPRLQYLELYDDCGEHGVDLASVFPSQGSSSGPFPCLVSLHLQKPFDFEHSPTMPFLRSLGSLRHIALTNGNSLPSLRHWPDLQSLHVSGSLTKSSVFPSMVRKVVTEATTKVRLILSDADTLAENIPLHRTPGGGYRLITAEEAELEDPEEEEWSDEYPDPGDFDDDRWGDGEDWGEFWGEESDTEQLGNDHTSTLPTPMYSYGHSGETDNSDVYSYADYNSGYGYDYDYAW